MKPLNNFLVECRFYYYVIIINEQAFFSVVVGVLCNSSNVSMDAPPVSSSAFLASTTVTVTVRGLGGVDVF